MKSSHWRSEEPYGGHKARGLEQKKVFGRLRPVQGIFQQVLMLALDRMRLTDLVRRNIGTDEIAIAGRYVNGKGQYGDENQDCAK